jgi:N utilization substance protein B
MESSRRLERARALELLYESQIKGISIDEMLRELPVQPEPFVGEVLLGVEQHAEQLDEQIASRLINWDLDRIALIDKLILRIAVWELTNRPQTPVAVVISEAVELAKEFSTDESGKFVNGVLGSFENR